MEHSLDGSEEEDVAATTKDLLSMLDIAGMVPFLNRAHQQGGITMARYDRGASPWHDHDYISPLP